jgi:hypothetical protein
MKYIFIIQTGFTGLKDRIIKENKNPVNPVKER